VTERIIAAALSEFQENGFGGAKTAAIAKRAGVVEALIFKHFGSKENLFQRVIFERLDRHYTSFATEHTVSPNDRASRLMESRSYIGAQQEFLRRNDRMFKSLIMNEVYGGIEAKDVSQLSGLQDYLDKMVDIVESRPDHRPEGRVDLNARISFATVLACTLFRDWLFPTGIADDEEIRNAVTDFVMEGAKASVWNVGRSAPVVTGE
jgi:AcrR family transcriptional regulator